MLRLKSDYLAIATLGFAEIIRAMFQWDKLGPVTNGSNMLRLFPTFNDFNIKNAEERDAVPVHPGAVPDRGRVHRADCGC